MRISDYLQQIQQLPMYGPNPKPQPIPNAEPTTPPPTFLPWKPSQSWGAPSAQGLNPHSYNVASEGRDMPPPGRQQDMQNDPMFPGRLMPSADMPNPQGDMPMGRQQQGNGPPITFGKDGPQRDFSGGGWELGPSGAQWVSFDEAMRRRKNMQY